MRWAGGLLAVLLIGGGNLLGALAQGIFSEALAAERLQLLRWCVTGAVWTAGLVLGVAIYALGAAMERIDALEEWLISLDTAVRNQTLK